MSKADCYQSGWYDAQLAMEMATEDDDVFRQITDNPPKAAEEDAWEEAQNWQGGGLFCTGDFIDGWLDHWSQMTGGDIS